MKPAWRMGMATAVLLLAVGVWFAFGDRAADTPPGLVAPTAAAGLPPDIASAPASLASGSLVGPQAHAGTRSVHRAAAEIHPHLHLIEAARRSLRPAYDQALQSTQPKDMLAGIQAFRECESAINSDPATLETELQASMSQSPDKLERIAAVRARVTRCAGFVAQEAALPGTRGLDERLVASSEEFKAARALASRVLGKKSLSDDDQLRWCDTLAKALDDAVLYYTVELAVHTHVGNLLRATQGIPAAESELLQLMVTEKMACAAAGDCAGFNGEKLLRCAYFGYCDPSKTFGAMLPGYRAELDAQATAWVNSIRATGARGRCR
jgi:hypothetical protein